MEVGPTHCSYNRGGDILRRIDEAGVKLVSVTEQIDTSTPIGKAIVGFQIAQAETESENTSKRVQRKHSTWAAQGVAAVGGNRPFGYRQVKANPKNGTPATLEPDPKESKMIRECVKRILSGESPRSVAEGLNESGVKPTAKGRATGSGPVRPCGRCCAIRRWPVCACSTVWKPSACGSRSSRGANGTSC